MQIFKAHITHSAKEKKRKGLSKTTVDLSNKQRFICAMECDNFPNAVKLREKGSKFVEGASQKILIKRFSNLVEPAKTCIKSDTYTKRHVFNLVA